VLAAAVLASGCGVKTSSSLELTLTGKVGSWTIDEQGPWTSCSGDGCRSFVYSAFNELIAPGFQPDPKPTDPSIAIQTTLLASKVVMGTIEIDAAFNRPDGAALVEIDLRSGSNVDRLYATEDPAEPWRADIVMDGQVDRPEGPFVFKGKMSLFPMCSEKRENVPSPCGAGLGDDGETAWFNKFIQTVPEALITDCPPEIAKIFLTPGSPFRGDAATRTVRSGSAAPLKCTATRVETMVCGATQDGVQADGCTWKVDALLGSFFNVGAKATGCDRPVKYCNVAIR
jgi:hypothetical protein